MEEKIDGSYADLDFNRIYGSGQSAGRRQPRALQ